NVPAFTLRFLQQDGPDLFGKRAFLDARLVKAGICEEAAFVPVAGSAGVQGLKASARRAREFSKNQKIAVGVLPGLMRKEIAETPGVERFVFGDGSQSSAAGEQSRPVHDELEAMVVRLIHNDQLQALDQRRGNQFARFAW